MTETLSTEDAARAVAAAARYEDALAQRTEGLTSMAWAPVAPGIYLTYAYAKDLAGFPSWGFALLWLPWVAVAGLTTFALWRSAGLSAPRMKDPLTPVGYLWRFLAFTGAIALALVLWKPDHHGGALLVVGLGQLLLAAIDPYRMSARGRWAVGACGAVLAAAAGVALALPETPEGFAIVVALSGAGPLAAGLWQTLRG
ncbi:MAG TPA: hypothetical protein VHH36_03160 [Candidatus Thermoplasmatota archaeon]|nr:hypothetical protein [Candidatus Thermoplasmatota archaeon]